nr:DUF202 domain-containing protein [Saccharopolyspora sp. HNM0983]
MQNERTALAWLRTGLAFAVGSVLLTRLIAHQHTGVAIVHFVLTLPLALAVVWRSWRRYLRSDRNLRSRSPLPGGALVLATSLLTAMLGFSGLGYVVLAHGG